MLHLTSCLFATVVIHAFYAHHELYHHLFLLVTICSIARYLTDNWWLHLLDAVAAHAACLAVLLDVETPKDRPWIVVFPWAVVALWVSEQLLPAYANTLHAILHVNTVVGMHVYLCPYTPSILQWV
jgi:hypothetical protein